MTQERSLDSLPLIGVISGPTATVLNTPPVGVDPVALVPQRLAADAVIEIEPGSMHPLGAPASSPERPGLQAHLRRGQLLSVPTVEDQQGPQRTFFPSAERLYEEIDVLNVDDSGRAGALSRVARYQHFRAGPPAGYEGEVLGEDYFPYGTWDARAEPSISSLIRITNTVQEVVARPELVGVQWLEGSPVVEETLYWLNLLIDTDKPIVGQVSQHPHRSVAADGARNLIDGARYIASGAWTMDGSRDVAGPVLVVDGVVRTARGVYKVAGRPGGYTGGGPIATCATQWPIRLEYVPTRQHTWSSELRLSTLPPRVTAVAREGGTHEVPILDAVGRLSPDQLPVVDIVVYGRYGYAGNCGRQDLGVEDLITHNRNHHGLAGIVLEGIAPNGWATRECEAALGHAVYSGFPVVWCGRGRPEDPVGKVPRPFVAANDLSATKARMLLMACLLRHGAAPVASHPRQPTATERQETNEYVTAMQQVFDTH